MSDTPQAVANAYAIMGLKARDANEVITTLRDKYQIEASDADGFLNLEQNGAPANIATVLQSYFKNHPDQFVGHAGEIRYKADCKDNATKVKFIRDHGYEAWAALPATENSPEAKNVLKPVILSTEMKAKEWLQLTPKERIAGISAWGDKAIHNVEKIMARK
jgi:hypothetical protein